MGVSAIMCVCYDSIELHLCKILMRYNCFKIREKKVAAHDTIDSFSFCSVSSSHSHSRASISLNVKCDLITSN